MIKCEHLVKKYMSTTAVSDLSLDIIHPYENDRRAFKTVLRYDHNG